MHFPDLRPHILLAKTISHVAHTRHIQTPQLFFVSSPHFAFVASRLSQSASVLASTMSNPISIIVAGASTVQGAEFLKHAAKRLDKFVLIDVRDWIHRDPMDQSTEKAFKVAHWENSDCLHCQLGMLRQPSFVTCVRDCAFAILGAHLEKKAFIVYCTAGQHRSDAVAKALATRVFNNQADDDRIFNCNVFTLSGARNAEVVVNEAMKWIDEPWVIVKHDVMWAHNAQFASSVAHAALAEVDKLNDEIHTAVNPLGTLPKGCDLRRTEAKVEDIIETECKKAADVARSSNAVQLADGPGGEAVIGRAPKRARVEEADDDEVETVEVDCPFCGGTGVAEETAKIDTVEAWSAALERRWVDDGARLDWCTLYCAPHPLGKQEALSIIHKVLKKASGDYAVHNPSGFVVSSVKAAWRLVRDGDDKGKGKR